jgi:hypothetical protein
MTYVNDRRRAFLGSIPLKGFEHDDSEHASHCKFCFSYFTVQDAGQDFSDWELQKLSKMLHQLKNYGEFPLKHWKLKPTGKGSGHVLEIYKGFPHNSAFKPPVGVPNDAEWGRFRLNFKTRLVGFVVPDRLHDMLHKSNHRFDANTFYVVFLDDEHRFYSTEKP